MLLAIAKSIRHNMRLQNYCRHLKLQLAYHTCTWSLFYPTKCHFLSVR